MRTPSPALWEARKEEIINACEALYGKMHFKDVTIKEIGSATSFTRTSIYNYFQTKEEIFLALMQREYAFWADDLQKEMDSVVESRKSQPKQMQLFFDGSGIVEIETSDEEELFFSEEPSLNRKSKGAMAQNSYNRIEQYASMLARSLEKRELLLKILATNFSEIEEGCRKENLQAYGEVRNNAVAAVDNSLKTYFPGMTDKDRQNFLAAFLPFMSGVFPYTEAAKKEGLETIVASKSTYDMFYGFLVKLLK